MNRMMSEKKREMEKQNKTEVSFYILQLARLYCSILNADV